MRCIPRGYSDRGDDVVLKIVRACLCLCVLFGAMAWGQAQNYPDRPVRLVVAFPPGGATDTFVRQLTDELKDALGQAVIIENRGGGGGYIAWNQVATSDPDGYTLLVAENALGVSQALYKRHASNFNPLTQYDAIAALASSPLVLAVANNTNVKTLAELVAYSKSLPQKMNYAHAGVGTVSHLVFEVIQDAAGMDTVPVPYKGGGPAVADVVAGHVAAIVSAVPVGKTLIEGGKLTGIAVTSPARSPVLPSIPSPKELGVKHADVDLQFWWGIFGPKGMPDVVKAKIEKAFQTVMADAKVRERLAKVDINPSFAPAADLRTKLESEIANWTKFIDKHGIKAE
jgi:tripartite-type tricarboxylate transporter receptor subunit TctC